MMKAFVKITLLLALLIPAAATQVRAQEASQPAAEEVASEQPRAEESAQEEAEPDIKQLVLGHLGDSYEWHIASTGHGGEWSIPLPVIVHSPVSGWHFFSSAHLREGAEYEGLRIASEGDYAGKIVERQADGSDLRPLDLSLTKTAAALLLNSVILLALVLGASSWYRRHKATERAPKGFVGLFEMLVSGILDGVIKPCVGPRYRKFAPYLLTVFFFIFVNNLMGLIPFFPGGANVSGNIAVTFLLALATFVAVNLFGTKHYWKDILWPDVPVWLKAIPIMPLIEFVGIFTKPFALMIRLFANMMAGHAVILSLTCVIFATASMGPVVNGSMSVVSVLFTIFMYCLELLVAFLQAYVFTMLSAVFIGLAQESPEKHPADPAADNH